MSLLQKLRGHPLPREYKYHPLLRLLWRWAWGVRLVIRYRSARQGVQAFLGLRPLVLPANWSLRQRTPGALSRDAIRLNPALPHPYWSPGLTRHCHWCGQARSRCPATERWQHAGGMDPDSPRSLRQ